MCPTHGAGFRSEDVIFSFPIHHHDPVMGRGVPEDLGVAFRENHEGIFLVGLPGAATIQAVGEALRAVVETRPEGNHRRVGRIGGKP